MMNQTIQRNNEELEAELHQEKDDTSSLQAELARIKAELIELYVHIW